MPTVENAPAEYCPVKYITAFASPAHHSSIVCEVIGTVFFLYKTYFKPKIHKTVTSN